jgi:thiamine biosynthesis protein ThiS
MATRTLTLNGESRAVSAASVAELIAELSLDIRQIAVEKNGTIIPRSAYAATELTEGDAIELVSFIGGG